MALDRYSTDPSLDAAYAAVLPLRPGPHLTAAERRAYVQAIDDALEAIGKIGGRHPALIAMDEHSRDLARSAA